MLNDGLEIYQKPEPATDFCDIGDEKSMFQQSCLDDDFEMESDEDIGDVTDQWQMDEADQGFLTAAPVKKNRSVHPQNNLSQSHCEN